MATHSFVIIGSGFGGQCAAIRLLQRGITDFRILERRDFMGGTWCQNRYPGAAVDVESPLYSLSFEPYPWSQMLAERDELERYTNLVIDKYGLRGKTTLCADVTGVRWDEERMLWVVATRNAGTFEARVVVNASGPLSTPVIPDLPGRDSFEGAAFHTNAWDHGFDYKGKRVAVVGSGASAAQVIPAIAPDIAELHVFQRTPHWVLPRPDRRFSKIERMLLSYKPVYDALRWAIYWRLEMRVIGLKYSRAVLRLFGQRPAERHLERQVSDPDLRRKLTPDYAIGCKRVVLSSTLYPTLSQPHVSLHDRHDGIAEVNARGILTRQGTQLDLDLIVWATGYDATDGVIAYPVVGRGGLALSEVWKEFPRAYLGTAVPGFPNLFVITGPNTGIGHTSALFVIESQLQYVLESLRHLEVSGKRSIEVHAWAEAAYTQHIHEEMNKTVWKSGGCQSWYQSESGHVVAMFPGFSFTYRRLARRFRPEHHVCA